MLNYILCIFILLAFFGVKCKARSDLLGKHLPYGGQRDRTGNFVGSLAATNDPLSH